MRARSFSATLAVLGVVAIAGCAAVPPPHTGLREPLDHYNPVQLNELAVAAVHAGDLESAWILLERAALLAPHDRRIARNLATVKAARRGDLTQAAEPPPSSRRQQGGPTITPDIEPPPIWPAR